MPTINQLIRKPRVAQHAKKKVPALQQIVAILPVKGADLVGPLPAELQNVIVYAAGIAARTLAGTAQERAGARGMIGFMATPAVAAVIRAKGMEPG